MINLTQSINNNLLDELITKMINTFKVSCKCGFKSSVQYGNDGRKVIYETFSCPKCKNLFSLEYNKQRKCPKCKNTNLKPYNPNKKENIEFYRRMNKIGMLSKSKLNDLEEFWQKIGDDECPKCGKKQLKW